MFSFKKYLTCFICFSDTECDLHIGGIGNRATKHGIQAAFSKHGPVEKIWIAMKPPGFAFVRMGSPAAALKAARYLNGTGICGSSHCTVKPIKGPESEGARRLNRVSARNQNCFENKNLEIQNICKNVIEVCGNKKAISTIKENNLETLQKKNGNLLNKSEKECNKFCTKLEQQCKKPKKADPRVPTKLNNNVLYTQKSGSNNQIWVEKEKLEDGKKESSLGFKKLLEKMKKEDNQVICVQKKLQMFQMHNDPPLCILKL